MELGTGNGVDTLRSVVQDTRETRVSGRLGLGLTRTDHSQGFKGGS